MQSTAPPKILSINIPQKVETTPQPPSPSIPATAPVANADGVIRAIFKYRNEKGRNAILASAKTIHHDFGAYNSSLSVSLLEADLDELKRDENVEWFEGDGKVVYCSIR